MSRVYTIPSKTDVYRDVEFDSLLNASWAKFFDARRIKWMFEPQAFRLPCRPNKRYWPDFRLKDIGYAEVKCDDPNVPEGFTPMEFQLCAELCIRTGHRVLILIGEPCKGDHPCFVHRNGEAFLEDWRFE